VDHQPHRYSRSAADIGTEPPAELGTGQPRVSRTYKVRGLDCAASGVRINSPSMFSMAG
jgi:hypothetical protein